MTEDELLLELQEGGEGSDSGSSMSETESETDSDSSVDYSDDDLPSLMAGAQR